MRCKNCGNVLEAGMNFCERCGVPVPRDEAPAPSGSSAADAGETEITSVGKDSLLSASGTPARDNISMAGGSARKETGAETTGNEKVYYNVQSGESNPFRQTENDIPDGECAQREPYDPGTGENTGSRDHTGSPDTNTDADADIWQTKEERPCAEKGRKADTVSIRKDHITTAAVVLFAVAVVIIAIIAFRHADGDGSDGDMETNAAADMEAKNSSADYDTDVWDYRLPEPPGYVSQEFYAIFYEKSRDNRIELSVFDIDGNLDGNYIVWAGTGNPLVLYNQNVIRNCDQFYYDGSKWVEFNSGYYRIGDSAKNIISSNLDVRDPDGGMIRPHITSSGISDPLDLSQYQAQGEGQKEGQEQPVRERTAEKIYIYPGAPDRTEKVYVYPENGSDGYILPGSDYRYISRSELYGLSALQLRLARNEIYARYGRMFKDQGLQDYFNSCSWYWPSIEPDDFKESMLNSYEKANRDLIVEYEKDMGYRGDVSQKKNVITVSAETVKLDPDYFSGTWSGTYIGTSYKKKKKRDISLYIGTHDNVGNVRGVAEIDGGDAGYYYWEGSVDFKSGTFSFERKKWLSDNPEKLKKLKYKTTYNPEKGSFSGYITKDPERTIQFSKTDNDGGLAWFWDEREYLIREYN